MGNNYDEKTVPADVTKLQETTEGSEVFPYLVVLTGSSMGSLFRLGAEKSLIGRSPECDVLIDDESISREHARLIRSADGDYVIEDLESTNGTYKQGRRVVREPLREGERFQVGGTVLLRLSLSTGVEDSFRQLYDASLRDPLTGLHNRRHLAERLEAEQAYASRHARPLSLVMIDVDFFKKVNDSLGHQAGDQVLRKLAELLQGAVRAEDIVARYGGEEFVILAPGIDLAQAEMLAERIRKLVGTARFSWSGQEIRVTISAGVATCFGGSSAACEELITSADLALMEAKNQGRNVVVRGGSCDTSTGVGS